MTELSKSPSTFYAGSSVRLRPCAELIEEIDRFQGPLQSTRSSTGPSPERANVSKYSYFGIDRHVEFPAPQNQIKKWLFEELEGKTFTEILDLHLDGSPSGMNHGDLMVSSGTTDHPRIKETNKKKKKKKGGHSIREKQRRQRLCILRNESNKFCAGLHRGLADKYLDELKDRMGHAPLINRQHKTKDVSKDHSALAIAFQQALGQELVLRMSVHITDLEEKLKQLQDHEL